MIQILSLAQKPHVSLHGLIDTYSLHTHSPHPPHSWMKSTQCSTSSCHVSHAALNQCGCATLSISKVDFKPVTLYRGFFIYLMMYYGGHFFYLRQIYTNYTGNSNSGGCCTTFTICVNLIWYLQ